MFLAAAMTVALAGCGSSDSASMKAEAPMEAAGAYAYETDALYDAAAEEAWDEGGSSGSSYEMSEADAKSNALKDSSRKLITTLNISAETDDMDTLLAFIEHKVDGLGGYIESSNIYNGSMRTYGDKVRQSRNADMTIRIPAPNLPGFVSDVQERSNITNQSKSMEDVTLSYADIESHKRMLKAEEERLLKFMEGAETIEDMLTIEERLTDVQYQIDSMESKLRTYDNKINYSTVYLSIEEVKEYTIPEEEPDTLWEEIGAGFKENLDSVIEGFRDFFVWFVTHIPQLIVWAVVIFVIVKIVGVCRGSGLKKRAAAAENGTGRPLTPKEQAKVAKLREKEAKKAAKAREKAMKSGKIPPEPPVPPTPPAPPVPPAGE